MIPHTLPTNPLTLPSNHPPINSPFITHPPTYQLYSSINLIHQPTNRPINPPTDPLNLFTHLPPTNLSFYFRPAITQPPNSQPHPLIHSFLLLILFSPTHSSYSPSIHQFIKLNTFHQLFHQLYQLHLSLNATSHHLHPFLSESPIHPEICIWRLRRFPHRLHKRSSSIVWVPIGYSLEKGWWVWIHDRRSDGFQCVHQILVDWCHWGTC